jgi:tRNA (adenine22-N1)-methyltransferase
MFSRRLIEIASLIPNRANVVDVGCDHGLLDIYLTINRDCHCIASDISDTCLDKARENIKKFKLEDEIELVKSDGLSNIKYKKSDYIVIAGMGTETILNILENCSSDNIIVQTNTDLFDFRETITDSFEIVDERVIYERKIFYVIMKLKRGKKKYSYADYFIGPIIKDKDTGVYKEYKEYLLEKYTSIYNNIPFTNLNKRLEIKSIIRAIKKYCK